MSLRLTKAVRSDICHDVMQKAFTKEREGLLKKDNAVAMTVLEFRRAAFLRPFKGKASDLPKLPDFHKVNYTGVRIHNPGAGYYDLTFKLTEPMLMPACSNRAYYGSTHLAIDFDKLPKPLQKIVADQATAWKAFKEKLDEFSRSVWGILNSATTLKKLIEAWPEGVVYFPPEADGMTTALVAMEKINEVNAALGLKTSPGREPPIKAKTVVTLKTKSRPSKTGGKE